MKFSILAENFLCKNNNQVHYNRCADYRLTKSLRPASQKEISKTIFLFKSKLKLAREKRAGDNGKNREELKKK